jgi:glycosyltransferase involved in cell wall biosynthesis
MHIAIVTDAWHPQRNGVVRVLDSVIAQTRAQGHRVDVISPDLFINTPCPTYPEIRLAVLPARKVTRLLDEWRPDAIHIATEGPLGRAARAFCLERGFPFTTAYHTKFPQYIHARVPLPLPWLYASMRRFHAPSSAVMAPSATLAAELRQWGFANVKVWSHGVDTDSFRPQPKDYLSDRVKRPIHMYVGRVTVEKNLPAFLDLDLPGSKVVVGEGPSRAKLREKYRDAHFFVANGDAELAKYYSAADVFVFPSLTDTFGLVMLEALACGLPVAAFPVPGPLDAIGDSGAGVLDRDLVQAVERARAISPAHCRAYAERFSWDAVTRQFLDWLAPIGRSVTKEAA